MPAIVAVSAQVLRPPANAAELEQYFDLRWRVLREPWSQQRGQEKDRDDAGAFHLALWLAGQMVAVGRAHFPVPGLAQIRYMAVKPEVQRLGLGSRLLDALESHIAASGVDKVALNARARAVRFYARHGYSVVGPSPPLFEIIPHCWMEKWLS